jgi:hypothetical protein
MRLRINTAPENVAFAEWLARMSHEPGLNGTIPIPPMIRRTMHLQNFLDRIYPPDALRDSPTNPAFFVGRAILTPTNETVGKWQVERDGGTPMSPESDDGPPSQLK